VIHVLDPYHGIQRGTDDAETALAYLEETIMLEGPETIAAFILEPVTGTNGILVPPDGYLQGVREICDRYGILMIADGSWPAWPQALVRGRPLGRRARHDHDGQGPDELVPAARRGRH
jgi:hypothetical protein